MAEKNYICVEKPNFYYKGTKRQKIEFKRGHLLLTDDAEIELLDRLIRDNPHFSQLLRCIEDDSTIQEVIRAHQEQMSMQHRAVSGQTTSMSFAQMAMNKLAERDAQLIKQGVRPEDLTASNEQLKQDLQLTGAVLDPKANPVRLTDGFKPDEPPSDAVKGVFDVLNPPGADKA